MRVLVCGGRDYRNWKRLRFVLNRIHKYHGVDVLIEGGAKGADLMASSWAAINGVPAIRFPADWHRHGKAAGHIRNQQMLDEGKPDLVVAFPGGKGTADMVRRARKAKIPVQREVFCDEV